MLFWWVLKSPWFFWVGKPDAPQTWLGEPFRWKGVLGEGRRFLSLKTSAAAPKCSWLSQYVFYAAQAQDVICVSSYVFIMWPHELAQWFIENSFYKSLLILTFWPLAFHSTFHGLAGLPYTPFFVLGHMPGIHCNALVPHFYTVISSRCYFFFQISYRFYFFSL